VVHKSFKEENLEAAMPPHAAARATALLPPQQQLHEVKLEKPGLLSASRNTAEWTVDLKSGHCAA
jgi:hypothetical protein